jgi:hypothetical protein
MILIYGGSGQRIYTKLTNVTTGLPVTNDAANITARISINGGTFATTTNSITEVLRCIQQ